MVQILSGLITYLLLAIYCHNHYQEKVSIKRVRELRIRIQNELRDSKQKAPIPSDFKEQGGDATNCKNLTGHYWELKEYFEKASGHGVLATASGDGHSNQAVFARPHFMEDGTVAFIMPHKLTHKNLQENPHAAYLFMEGGPGYKGKRVYLTKVREEQDTELLHALRRRTLSLGEGETGRTKVPGVFPSGHDSASHRCRQFCCLSIHLFYWPPTCHGIINLSYVLPGRSRRDQRAAVSIPVLQDGHSNSVRSSTLSSCCGATAEFFDSKVATPASW